MTEEEKQASPEVAQRSQSANFKTPANKGQVRRESCFDKEFNLLRERRKESDVTGSEFRRESLLAHHGTGFKDLPVEELLKHDAELQKQKDELLKHEEN